MAPPGRRPPQELPAFRERLGRARDRAARRPRAVPRQPRRLRARVAPSARSSVLANELRVAEAYGAGFVNVHVGSHRGEGADAGHRPASRAGSATSSTGVDGDAPGVGHRPRERHRAAGSASGRRWRSWARSSRAVRRRAWTAARFGFCLDTAHLWGAGYPIDTAAGVDAHGRRVRRAGRASTGCAWSTSTTPAPSSARGPTATSTSARAGSAPAGLARVVTHPALGHVTYMLETPGMDEGYDAVNLARVRDLAAGRPLAAAAAGGVPHPQRQGPQRPGRGRRAGGRRVTDADRRPPRRRRAGAHRPAPPELELGSSLAILVLAALTRLPGPRGARPLGRRPGHRHARAARAGRRRRGAAARPADVDRDVPPRRRLLLPARPGRVRLRGRPGRRDGEIALFGIGAVAAIWWLARLVGGPARGGDRRAARRRVPRRASTSPRSSGTRTSIPAAAALAYAARSSAGAPGRARWWLLAGRRRDGHDAVPRPGRRDRAAAGRGVGRRPRPAPARRRARAAARSAAGSAAAARDRRRATCRCSLYELGHGFAETAGILELRRGRRARGGDGRRRPRS